MTDRMHIELRDIHKSFGAVKANDGISLTIEPGEILGIVGENGAGKSTLMKVLSGFLRPDYGKIILDKKPASIHFPADAIRTGIGMLHQDPLDFPPMKALDNFLIGSPGRLFPSRRAARAELAEISSSFGFQIDPDAYVEAMTVGERQQLEIARLLWLGCCTLILDEPTTGISAQQKKLLFAALRRLAGQGKTVIFVSHKLGEIDELCSRAVVLRQGKLVGEARPPYSMDQLVEMMFGKKIQRGERMTAKPGKTMIEVKGLAIEGVRIRLGGINLAVKAGEVIGLAGMEGSGQGLLLKGCTGLMRPVSGKVILKGRDMTGRNYHAYMNQGVAVVPAARLEEGLVAGLTLTEHFLLAKTERPFFIDWNSASMTAQHRIDDFNIRGRAESKIESLSGGNQQRALLSLVRPDASLILLEHPTRGLDIESAVYVWEKLHLRLSRGASVIFISSDMDEIIQQSDRIVVFFSGRASSPIDARTTSVEELGNLIGGMGWNNCVIAGLIVKNVCSFVPFS